MRDKSQDQPGDARPVTSVNVLQGTDSHFGFSRGNTLPLIARPFGMTHWCPQTNEKRGGWFFHPGDRKLEGIRATHQPSPWIGDYGHFAVMPQTGTLRTGAGERASGYRPENATFLPHYFRADLLASGCTVELTPTERCAVIRCHFPVDLALDPFGAALPRRLLFEPGPGEAWIEVLPGARKLRGWTRANSGGVPEEFALYFVAVFDADATAWGVFQGGESSPGTEQAHGERAGGYVEFAPGDLRVEARVGTSFIGWEQAELNLERETGGLSFEALCERGAAVWDAALGRLSVEGGSESARRTFTSCLYRTQLFPRDFHEPDAEGRIRHRSPYDGQVHEGPLVTDNGFWDTYRTVYPLFSLLCPDRLGEILRGWTNAYRESGWFPTWASPGHRTCADHFLQQLVRPRGQAQWAYLPVLLRDIHPADGRPSEPLVSEVVDEPVDLHPAHAIAGLGGRPWRHRPLVWVEAGVGAQIQSWVVEQAVDLFQRQPSFAMVSYEVQDRFSVLHCAYLPIWTCSNHLPPFAV